MAITSNNQYYTYTDVKDTFPVSTSVTGTITKAGANLIVGTGTLFTTEFQSGEWLYVAGITEMQQIDWIQSDTELVLKQQFTGAVSGATYKRVPRQTWRTISWKIDDAAAALINGQTFPAESTATLNYQNARRPDPIIIDSDTNSNSVFVQVEK